MACKRVPPFRDRATFERYREVVLRNIDELRAAGVRVLDTEVRVVSHDGRLVGFVVQPLLPADTLGEAVLKASVPSAEHPLVVAMVDHVLTATTDRRGVDATRPTPTNRYASTLRSGTGPSSTVTSSTST